MIKYKNVMRGGMSINYWILLNSKSELTQITQFGWVPQTVSVDILGTLPANAVPYSGFFHGEGCTRSRCFILVKSIKGANVAKSQKYFCRIFKFSICQRLFPCFLSSFKSFLCHYVTAHFLPPKIPFSLFWLTSF